MRFVRILIIPWLLVASGATGDEVCEGALAPPLLDGPTYGGLLKAMDDRVQFSTTSIGLFHREGLRELQRLAGENDLTIRELVQDLHAVVSLFMLQNETPAEQRRMDILMRNLDANYVGIEALIGKTKLKANNYVKLKSTMLMLRTIGQLAAVAQLERHDGTRLNPFGPFDQTFITALFSAVEDGVLDLTMEELSKLEEAPRVTPKVAAKPEVSHEFEISPGSETTPPPPPASIEAAPPRESNLARILQTDLPLRANEIYRVTTSRGRELNVQMSPGVMKDTDGGTSKVLRRLLKGIIVEREHAGIKMLPDVGPRIVEVKAILHGHKRLMGCLDGLELRLLRLIDIKDQRATYFKRIPRDMCD